MSEWDSLTLDDKPNANTSALRAAAADIDDILKRKKRADAEVVAADELDAAFDNIASELGGGESKYQWSATNHDALEKDFEGIASTMDALEIQDELLDDAEREDGKEQLQAHYKNNIAKLTAEIDKLGSATNSIQQATNASNQARVKVSRDDANSLSGAMASVNAMLASTPTPAPAPRAQSSFTDAENLPPGGERVFCVVMYI